MLGYYNIYSTVFHNNEEIEHCYIGKIITEEPKNKTIKVTWDNLKTIHSKIDCGFNIINFKKGRVISFFNFNIFKKNSWDIKEWKYKNPNITIKIDYVPIKNYSLQDVLKYHDGKLAYKFLEQGKEKKINER